MKTMRVLPAVLLTASLSACAAKAQVRAEPPLPLLDPPSSPPRGFELRTAIGVERGGIHA